MHQGAFLERVLRTYRHQCAFCALQHVELLDAAHITPDSALHGEPVVSNGMSLCRLHHAAFDRLFLGFHPDYVIPVRPDILYEIDGPMLRHGRGCRAADFGAEQAIRSAGCGEAGGEVDGVFGGWVRGQGIRGDDLIAFPTKQTETRTVNSATDPW